MRHRESPDERGRSLGTGFASDYQSAATHTAESRDRFTAMGGRRVKRLNTALHVGMAGGTDRVEGSMMIERCDTYCVRIGRTPC